MATYSARAAFAVLSLLLLAVRAAPAGDYVDREFGFRLRLPAGWTQTPTEPGEKIEVAKFKDDRKGDFSSLSIHRFSTAKAETTPTDGEIDEIPRMPGPWMAAPTDARGALEAMVERASRYLVGEERKLPEPETFEVGQTAGKYWILEFEHPKRKGYGEGMVAGMVTRSGEEYLLVFRSPISRFNRKQQQVFLKILSTFRFAGDDSPAEDDDEDDPEKRGRALVDEGELLDLAKRERVKKELVGTWRFLDTRHYIIVYNCDDLLARVIAERIEWMRKFAYEEVFPPAAPIEEAMVVRVCKEMDEYHHYGGPQGTAGFWVGARDELVFPDLGAGKKPDDDTLGVLHHEGFHQYVHYALGKHDPPAWFNEGFAEYFYCARPAGKRMKFEERHPKRYGVVKSALGTGSLAPLKDFLKMTQAEYYQNSQLYYSQGWAVTTWLLNVTRNERYRQIPHIYFREMRDAYRQAAASDNPFAGFPGRAEGSPIERAAMEKALEGVDLDRLHEDFLSDLKHRM